MRMRRAGSLLLVGIISTLIGYLAGAPQPGGTATADLNPLPGAAGVGDPYYPRDGNGGYDALAYDVSVRYDPRSKRLDGDSTLTATATHDLSSFNLDLRKLAVTSVEVNGRPAAFSQRPEFELVIIPAEPIAEGSRFTTRVRYAGKPGSIKKRRVGDQGWQISRSGGAFVLGEPHSAAFWYPVNDHPRDKASFRLTARVPEPWIVVSIGKEGPRTTEKGWATYTWIDPNPVASYLTTIAIDKFTVDRSKLPDGIPVVSAYAPGMRSKRSVEAKLPDVVAFMNRKFGRYPQVAAGGIYLNETIPFALETQGRPTYAAWAEEGVLVHEYAHQWFGNSVSVESWSDMCLNECFASYAQWLWIEDQRDADIDEHYRAVVDQVRTMDVIWSPKLHEMGSGNEFDGVYSKGLLALHALRRKIGEPAFDSVLRDWPAAHRHANASWPEFERFVAQRTEVDLDEFFDIWFRGKRIPPDEHLYPGSLRR